jgi:tetratricopeptide (TPR) repeat protein
MIRRIANYIGWNLRMPWWLFWAFLASITWFYVVRRIISWDLWWHMAAGRYLVENGAWGAMLDWRTWVYGGEYLLEKGIYPDNSVFTFSPVTNTGFLSRTWLADIIFHKVYEWGGFYGLQFFRFSFILAPVFLMLHLTRWKHNIWTLLAASLMIIGTMQKHLTKNAIYSLPCMGLICWIWIEARYRGKTKLLWILPFLFLFWTQAHGEVLVGIYLLGAIMVGEVFDTIATLVLPYFKHITWKNISLISSHSSWIIFISIASVLVAYFLPWSITLTLIALIILFASFPNWFAPLFEHARTRRPNWRFFLTASILSLICIIPVHIVWTIDFNFITQTIAKLVPGYQNTSTITSQDSPSPTPAPAKITSPQELKAQLKKSLRNTFSGTDADMVAEYQWPFDIIYVLSIKGVLLFFILYSVYFILRVTLGLRSLSLSLELPSFFLIFLSLGYLRTVSFVFIVVVPFIAYALSQKFFVLDVLRRRVSAIFLLLIYLTLICLHGESLKFNGFNNLLFESLGYAQYLAIPFLFVPLIVGIIFLIKNEQIFKYSLNGLTLALGLYTSVCLACFAHYENKTYLEGNFHGVTGFIDTEPGLGKSNKFFDGMADYVTAKLPPDKNIYNTYNMGGYLQWKWYGKRKVFIDGRSAIFEPTFYQAYTQNNAQEYIQKNDFDHAFINLVVDKDRFLFFLQQGWTPIAYDCSMTILQRPKSKIEDVYGIVPEFSEGERPISKLENYDRENLGNFINGTLHHMMLFGRIKDGKAFMEQALPVIDQLQNEGLIKQLKDRKAHVEQIAAAFGDINHRAIGPLCKKIFDRVEGVPFHLAVADTHYALQQWPQAEGNYIRAYQLKKDDKNILIRLGEVFYLQNKHEQALQAYQDALKIDNKDSRILNAALMPLIATKQYDKAIAIGQESLNLNPNMPDTHFNIGVAFLEKGNKEKAKLCFENCLKLNPGFAQAEIMLARINSEAPPTP